MMDAGLNWGSESEGGVPPPTNERTAVARILVIEDSAESARILVEEIRRSDDRFEATSAASAAVGLARIDRGGIDCVLLDYRLPDADGLECLSRIRRKWLDL